MKKVHLNQVNYLYLYFIYIKLLYIAETDKSFKRKISKISLHFEKLKNKSKENNTQELSEELNFSELDYYDNMAEQTEKMVNENEKDSNASKKFKIYFYLNINKDNTFIIPIQTDFFKINKQYVYELIKYTVKKINNEKIKIKLNSIEYFVSLKDIENNENCGNDDFDFYINNYEIKPCKKKNHIPKNDSPSYHSSSLLKNIENDNISFICKSPLNIMIREKNVYEEKRSFNYESDDEDL